MSNIVGKGGFEMASQHEISEYIENLPLQKKLCKGYRPDDVYEVICNLSSMYNQLLSESLVENEELKRRLEYMEKAGNMKMPGMSWEEKIEISGLEGLNPDPKSSAAVIEETVLELEKLLDVKEMEMKEAEGFSNIELKTEQNTVKKEDRIEDVNLEEIQNKSEATGATFVEEVKDTAPKKERVLSDKELQKLKRGDLLEILLEQSKENDSLVWQIAKKDQEIRDLHNELADRKIELQEAGTIAEASFKLNGVLEAAEKAAQQYLDNLQRLYEKEEYLCNVKEQEVEARCQAALKKTREQCEEYIQMTEQRCMEREKEAEEKCRYLNEKAKADVDKRWKELSRRLEEFYSSHRGLRELLASSKMI